MRAPSGWAVAVRRPEGDIEAVRHDLPRLSSRSRAARLPFVRGVMVLVESLTLGFRALSWSAQKSVGEEEEPISGRQIAVSMTIALVFFLAVFMVLPIAAANWAGLDASSPWFHIIEALVRISLFIGYIWAIGRSQEIKRVFRYHGAEHMTIHAYEAGDPLTMDQIGKYRPEHPRCGTSFLLIVLLVAIVIFTFLADLSFLPGPTLVWIVVSRIVLIPVIAGIAYELLKFSGSRPDGLGGRILAAPGLWLQRLTTAEPDEAMIEVAITSLLFALDPGELADVRGLGVEPGALAVLDSA